MNQILMTENKKRNSSSLGPIEIKNVVKFFAIALIVFGIFFIGEGSYAIYRESKGRNKDNLPVVSIKRVNDMVIIKANSNYKIENLIYSWNESEETKIPVEDTFIQEEAILPIENSTLNVKIQEESGRTIKYQKEFNMEKLDVTPPKIEIAMEGTEGNIKITATDETEIEYIAYKINGENEIRINKSETEHKTINYILKLQKGNNNVSVTAVDTSKNISTIDKIVAVSSTIIDVKVENEKLIIMAKNADGIKDIEVNLNGVAYGAKNINQKGIRLPLNLKKGKNEFEISIIDVNSVKVTADKKEQYVE